MRDHMRRVHGLEAAPHDDVPRKRRADSGDARDAKRARR
jgi:hypothetical protein